MVLCLTLLEDVKRLYETELLESEFIDNEEYRLMTNIKVFFAILNPRRSDQQLFGVQ